MSDFCLVRQPIFGPKGTLIGYEIRYRNATGEQALAQTLQSGAFDLVRGKQPAFLSCSAEQLLGETFSAADPSTLVLLLPPTTGNDPDIVAALDQFRAAGGHVALDGITVAESPSETLLGHASWIRVNASSLSDEEFALIKQRVFSRNPNVKVLAGRIELPQDHGVAMKAQAHGFQGTFFSRPEPVPSTELPQSTVAAIRLLGMARDPNIQDRKLEDVLESDPVLTFQLLQLVNSAAIGSRGVSSIGQALRLIGRGVFQRWLAVAVAASKKSSTGVDQELVRQAVARGRLLEQLGDRNRDAGTMFLVGLFSMLDAVFRMPLHEILERVALNDEATSALLDRSGPYADALSFAESYELGLFENATMLAQDMGIDPGTVSELYTNAVQWTAEALDSLEAKQPVGR
jgi:EAL and modified HD-GYP domain-containing signal transduction protein